MRGNRAQDKSFDLPHSDADGNANVGRRFGGVADQVSQTAAFERADGDCDRLEHIAFSRTGKRLRNRSCLCDSSRDRCGRIDLEMTQLLKFTDYSQQLVDSAVAAMNM